MNHAPKGEQRSRNNTAFIVAAHIKNFGASLDECLKLMVELWPCDPPLDADELETTVRSAYRKSQIPQGALAPEMQFDIIESTEPEAPSLVDKLNREYAVVNFRGKVRVVREVPDGIETFTVAEFKHLLGNQLADAGRGQRAMPLAEYWLGHSERRQFNNGAGLYASRPCPASTYNLWRGFAVEPRAGEWRLVEAYLRTVICAGNDALYRYLVGWLARLVQRPDEPGQVAIVLRGERGTGKSTLIEIVTRIFGRSGSFVLASEELLTGRFNDHLRGKPFIGCEEASWAGDRKAENRLKSLITDPVIAIEGKGENAVLADNAAHLIMATNDAWAVPAAVDERRFAVFDVADRHKQDRAFFKKLRGGFDAEIPAFLDALRTADISNFDVWAVPDTEALAQQKILTLRGPHKWLHECLERGAIGGYSWTSAGLEIPKTEAYDAYVLARKHLAEYRSEPLAVWARAVYGLLPGAFNESRPVDKSKSGKRLRQLAFASLGECREAFARALKSVGLIQWSTDTPDILGSADA